MSHCNEKKAARLCVVRDIENEVTRHINGGKHKFRCTPRLLLSCSAQLKKFCIWWMHIQVQSPEELSQANWIFCLLLSRRLRTYFSFLLPIRWNRVGSTRLLFFFDNECSRKTIKSIAGVSVLSTSRCSFTFIWGRGEKKKKVVKCKAKKKVQLRVERDATSCKSRRDFEQCLISIRYMFCPYAEKGELLRGKLIIQEKRDSEVEVKLLGRRETWTQQIFVKFCLRRAAH